MKMNELKGFIKNNKVVSVVLGGSILLNMFSMTSCNSATNNLELQKEEVARLEHKVEVKEQNYNRLYKQKEALAEKVKEAEPWFEMKEEERLLEQKRIEEEKKAQEEKERKEKEAEEKRKAEEERKAKEEAERKEKQGYNTGITYSQLARTPDEYRGEKVKFSGKVLQVQEADNYIAIRLAVGGNYNNVIFLVIETNRVEMNQRILEDDNITVYGKSAGIYTYETVMGNELSIPSMSVDKIDM